MTKFFRPALAVSAAVLAAMALASAWAWTRVPADARIPVHYDFSGAPDRLGGRAEALLIIPLVTLAVVALLAVLPLLERRPQNLESSAKAFNAVWIGLLCIMGLLHATFVTTALGAEVNIPGVIVAALGAMFLVLGNYLGKTRSNHVFGLRTPWTLGSERVWAATHRAGGRAFVALGAVLLLVAVVAPAAWLAPVVLLGTLGVVLAMVAYSWRLSCAESASR